MTIMCLSINRSRGGTQTATITLGGTYGTDLDLQMGTNNTSGPVLYSLTQDCPTVGGCSCPMLHKTNKYI